MACGVRGLSAPTQPSGMKRLGLGYEIGIKKNSQIHGILMFLPLFRSPPLDVGDLSTCASALHVVSTIPDESFVGT